MDPGARLTVSPETEEVLEIKSVNISKRKSIGVMRNILPHSAKQVSSHPVQVRCTALTLFYLLIRTSRPSPGLQSNVSEESSPLPDTR